MGTSHLEDQMEWFIIFFVYLSKSSTLYEHNIFAVSVVDDLFRNTSFQYLCAMQGTTDPHAVASVIKANITFTPFHVIFGDL